MIEKAFSGCPQVLWITLWGICVQRRQVLDSASPGLRCAISQQVRELSKINELASIRVIPEVVGAGRRGRCTAAWSLGISQPLSAHLPRSALSAGMRVNGLDQDGFTIYSIR